MAQVYIFFANGSEEIEGLTVVDLLRRAGIEIESVSIEAQKELMGSHNIPIVTDKILSEIDFDQADMLVLPGGMPGTKNLLKQEDLAKQIRKFNQEGKMLAAICAAPTVLAAAGVLDGRQATCYPGFEDQLAAASYVEQSVVCNQNIITSRGLGTAIEFSLAIVAHFKGKEEAKELSNKIIYG